MRSLLLRPSNLFYFPAISNVINPKKNSRVFHCFTVWLKEECNNGVRRVVGTSCPATNRLTTQRVTTQPFSSYSNKDVDPDAMEGAKLYRRYLELQDHVKAMEEETERIKSKKMFEAWKKASESSSLSSDSSSQETSTKNDEIQSNRDRMAGGVAVIRTLAKETKKSSSMTMTPLVQELRHQAAQLLALAADTHLYPPAMVRIGNDMLGQNAIDRAMQYYRAAGERGSAEGWLNLGYCLWESIRGTPNSDSDDNDTSTTKQAFDAFWNAANLGDDDAKYFLGVHLLGHDQDSLANLQRGLNLIHSAATAGHGGALHYLVLFYRNGNTALGVKPCSQQEFMERLDHAVQHDVDGESYFLRGSCLLAGDVYEKSPRRALGDFLMASDLGHSGAAISAGALLHNGMSDQIAQDRRKAFELYQHAGELGNLEGWRNVVSCYLHGHGVPQSTSIAKYIAETMLPK